MRRGGRSRPILSPPINGSTSRSPKAAGLPPNGAPNWPRKCRRPRSPRRSATHGSGRRGGDRGPCSGRRQEKEEARRGRDRPALGRLSLRVIRPSEEARAEINVKLTAFEVVLSPVGVY